MDSLIPIHQFTDRAVAGDGAGAFTHAPLLVPKLEHDLEPIDELPSRFHYANRTNPHFLSVDTGRRTMTLSRQLRSHNLYTRRAARISEVFTAAGSHEMQGNGDSGVLEANPGEILHLQSDNRLALCPIRRPSQLMRAWKLDAQWEKHFQAFMRTTRILYGSLMVFLVANREKKVQQGLVKEGRNYRADLKAASRMRRNGLWQHRDKRLVGLVPGVQIGDVFLYRIELCVVGLHGVVQGGIDYVPSGQIRENGDPIATSIVVSGGYEDNEDSGNVIIYSGQGGQAYHQHSQIADQKLKGGNLALERSMHYGIEIRVIRGVKHDQSPTGKLYIYDGLYKVVETWFDVGKSGFGIYKFKLVRIENQSVTGSSILKNRENQQVLVFNDVDDEPDPVVISEHIPKPKPKPTIPMRGYPCVSNCSSDCPCFLKNGGEYVYDKNGILIRGKPIIFECGLHCRCPPSCRNRQTQKLGVSKTFQVFRTIDRKWGVRCLDLIPSGSFVCELAGVGLTMDQARVVTMNGEDNLIYSNQFGERWREWGEVSKAYPKYVGPKYPSIPIPEFALDVSQNRNFAYYIRHSTSDPNLMVQKVAFDEMSLKFPCLMLFATQCIPPLRELRLDYGTGD